MHVRLCECVVCVVFCMCVCVCCVCICDFVDNYCVKKKNICLFYKGGLVESKLKLF